MAQGWRPATLCLHTVEEGGEVVEEEREEGAEFSHPPAVGAAGEEVPPRVWAYRRPGRPESQVDRTQLVQLLVVYKS